MVPVRFVVVCENGHVDEFPWVEWAHSRPGQPLDQAQICDHPTLRLNYSGKAGLMGLLVMCENPGCTAKVRSMMGSAGPDSLIGWRCSGKRPWLGPNGQEDCRPGARLRMLQRGATNFYFPKVASSILIPPFSHPIRRIVDDPHNWGILTSGVQEDGAIDESRLRLFAELKRLDLPRLKDVVTQKLAGVSQSADMETEEEFRLSEYRALLAPSRDVEDEFVTNSQDIAAYTESLREYIDRIVLVEKLAETRALTGFSRITPPPYREFDRQDQTQLSLKAKPWLPATRVYGEGIFFTLKKAALDAWATERVAKRYEEIVLNHVRIYQSLGRKPRNIPPKFFLLHTLAHILIRQLSFECGYGSSSLRERLYCWDEPGKEMAGIMIYTAAGDSEGTMGGLVRQGKPNHFETVLLRAIEEARWCSSDPLCIESRGQGIDSLNRAACHACALLPETSCEEGNRFLDRAALIGVPDDLSLGFFKALVAGIVSGTLT